MLGILFLLLAAAPALAAAVNRAHREGHCIGCGQCGRTPGHRCILDAARPEDGKRP